MTDDHYEVLLLALKAGTLNPAEFSHRDHVGVAVAALRRHSFFEAMLIVADGLQGVTQRAGVPEKFNATITMASMSLIAERLEGDDGAPIAAFIDRHPDLLSIALMRDAYPDGRLTSDLGRRVGLLPVAAFAPRAQGGRG
jgi:hypothetical protein